MHCNVQGNKNELFFTLANEMDNEWSTGGADMIAKRLAVLL
jgi:hypothetical protein